MLYTATTTCWSESNRENLHQTQYGPYLEETGLGFDFVTGLADGDGVAQQAAGPGCCPATDRGAGLDRGEVSDRSWRPTWTRVWHGPRCGTCPGPEPGTPRLPPVPTSYSWTRPDTCHTNHHWWPTRSGRPCGHHRSTCTVSRLFTEGGG